jgi:hypothetical protein
LERCSGRGEYVSVGAMLVIAVMYAAASYEQFILGNFGLAAAFAGWSIGQIGMAWAVK